MKKDKGQSSTQELRGDQREGRFSQFEQEKTGGQGKGYQQRTGHLLLSFEKYWSC